MSDLTDNWIYPLNEIQCVFASLSWSAIDIQKMPIGKKNHLLNETHFDLGWYVNKQNCRIWGIENPHAYIEKHRRTQNESLFGADFGPEA